MTSRDLTQSQELFDRARRRVPAGVSSNTRARAPHPIYFRRAAGAELWDADGNRYVDILMGNGAVLLGHGDPRVQEAVAKALETGLTTGVEWERVVEVAEIFLATVPTMEMVRFTNTGTEAVLHALHLARAATGRTRIAKVEGSYHGWTDEIFVSVWPDLSRAGPTDAMVPQPQTPGLRQDLTEQVVVLPFNDPDRAVAAIERHAGELAAVVLEPTLIDVGFIPGTEAFLWALRAACDRHGIVLMFDELLTGFNLAPGGMQQLTGVVPDLATFGKAIGNGYPIAALAGSEVLMRQTEPGRGPAFVGTFNGHAMALAAASAVLPVLADGSVQATVSARTERLKQSFAAAALKAGVPAQLAAGGSHLQWYFTAAEVRDFRSAATTDAAAYAAFTAALFERGVPCLGNPLSHHAISMAHDEPILDELESAFGHGLEAAAAVREDTR